MGFSSRGPFELKPWGVLWLWDRAGGRLRHTAILWDPRRVRSTPAGRIAMRRVCDHQLLEPFRTWIDRDEPLPPGVTVLPRTIDVWGNAFGLLHIGGAEGVVAGVPTVYVVRTHADDLGG